ncbi:potassium channel family protein [Pseudalkalibacillus hwajinpoensis]|uniref:Potassium channel family protein n=1 Tax=Guptibacillus hwajinpoensis TaxID=208199 RepID=A0A4V5PZ12_9BACL|nr:potassium channel family protein [Pseudalkalibacillus hwajinpoensis]TKD72188.1 potassium channel family protein [Pseudalkalibacillus hwajinpoensis]
MLNYLKRYFHLPLTLKLHTVYEITLATLVIYSIMVDTNYNLDWFIWGIFVIDYVTRLSLSPNKKVFVKGNVLEFIAIIPLGEIFQSARLIRLIRVVRLLAIINKRKSYLHDLFSKFNLDRYLVLLIASMFLASLPMVWLEPAFEHYGDALWWVIVTTTTVGYGDLYPVTAVGRIIAIFYMIVGISLIGIVTGTVASVITKRKKVLPPELEFVQSKLDEYPNLSEVDYEEMRHQLEKMENHRDR